MIKNNFAEKVIQNLTHLEEFKSSSLIMSLSKGTGLQGCNFRRSSNISSLSRGFCVGDLDSGFGIEAVNTF